jgi:DNA polymerase-4
VRGERSIVHVDLDAFFASAEQLDDASCRDRPVLVGGLGARSVVAAASYEARAHGCRSAMSMAEARRRCPSAIVRPVRMHRYVELSRQFMATLRSFSPAVEALSLDEAFVDLTGTERLHGDATQTVRRMVDRVYSSTGLHCSAGLAQSKFVAKIASDLRKPRGLVLVPAAGLMEFLAPLEISRLWGVGPVAAERFRRLGYLRFGDLQSATRERVLGDLGSAGERAWLLAQGIDDRPVESDHERKSIGHEETFGEDITDPRQLREILLRQVESVSGQLRSRGLSARTVTLKIRRPDFTTMTRQASAAAATDSTAQVWRTASVLLDSWRAAEWSPVRLLGVSLSGFAGAAELEGLFPDPDAARERRLDAATDALRRRFGESVIRRAGGA